MISYPDKIDLHMHSTVSDGTDTPEELLAKVREEGISLFSVTDHDDTKAGSIIRSVRKADDPLFITGVEFSCKDKLGKYHILGYGYDPEAESVRHVVQTGHNYRMEKVISRIDFLRTEFGFEFPQEELDALLAMDNPGKPHIGNLMVKYGFAETKEQAITEYINKHRAGSRYVRPEEAISGILGAGGIPVLAHPCYGSGDQLILGDDLARRLSRMKEFGLKGMEVFYSGFTGKLRTEMLSIAEQFGLFITAGTLLTSEHTSQRMS